MAECEYPGCDIVGDDDTPVRTYGFTIDGLVEHEMDYCDEHAPGSNVIDP